MRCLILVLVVLLIGCATSDKNWEIYSDKIATDMAPLNTRLRGTWVRKDKIKDFSSLKYEDYMNYARDFHDPSEVDYINFLTKKDTEVEFVGSGRDYVVCAENKGMLLVLCDKASTGMVDFVSKDIGLNLKLKSQSLLSNK